MNKEWTEENIYGIQNVMTIKTNEYNLIFFSFYVSSDHFVTINGYRLL